MLFIQKLEGRVIKDEYFYLLFDLSESLHVCEKINFKMLFAKQSRNFP